MRYVNVSLPGWNLPVQEGKERGAGGDEALEGFSAAARVHRCGSLFARQDRLPEADGPSAGHLSLSLASLVVAAQILLVTPEEPDHETRGCG